jgi:LytS/YehU family sensor histidine kinase
MGLANVRARLATLFQERAVLDLAANAAGGVRATIRLPYRAEADMQETP